MAPSHWGKDGSRTITVCGSLCDTQAVKQEAVSKPTCDWPGQRSSCSHKVVLPVLGPS